MMRKFRIFIPISAIVCSLLLCVAGCASVCDVEPEADSPAMVNLGISVSLADVSGAVSYAGSSAAGPDFSGITRADDKDAASDNEKMQKLRVIVVRPDGTVEHNRLIDLTVAATEWHDGRFQVVSDETKTVYLFVNEDTAVGNRRLLDYDLNKIAVGQAFPGDEVAKLTLQLNDAQEQISGPLPMSERHLVNVPDTDCSCNLFVTRAAVKFSFRFTNQSGVAISLTGLTIDKMARREWYMPRAVYAEDWSISEYDVPLVGNNEYYTYGEDKFRDEVVIADGNSVSLPPLYLLEGKYVDPYGDARNYGVNIRFGDQKLWSFFPNLSCLPRNTHVVVNVTVRNIYSDIAWEADVLPYMSVELEPGFGLEIKP